MIHKIHWQKWEDPFAHILKKSYEDDEEKTPYDEIEHGNIKGPFIQGPFGIIPIHEGNLPSKLFNFWRIDTTFRLINPLHIDILNNIDGIETLDILTSYRARIGIGLLFDEDEVKENVDKILLGSVSNINKEEDLKELLTIQYDYWAVAYQGKSYEIFNGSSIDEVEKKILEFKETKKATFDKIEWSWK